MNNTKLIIAVIIGTLLLAGGTLYFTKKAQNLGEGEVTVPKEIVKPTIKPLPDKVTINGIELDTKAEGEGSYTALKEKVITQLETKEPVNYQEVDGILKTEMSRCQIGLKDYSVQMEELYAKILSEGVCL